MKLKKGSKVEVLDKREVPCGSWCCAEIVSRDGNYYSVKYDCDSEDTGVTVQRVSSKAVRPCPPPVDSPRCWVPGDIVEVFMKNSWRVAEVAQVAGGDFFFVRVLGSSRKIRAHIYNLRMRMVWQDNKWVVIQKGSRECSNGITNSHSRPAGFSNEMPRSGIEVKTSQGDDRFIQQPCLMPLAGKKRRPYLCSPLMGPCIGASKKIKLIDEIGRCDRPLGTVPSHLLEKGQMWSLLKLVICPG